MAESAANEGARQIESITVVGAGRVGKLIGAMLADDGFDVDFADLRSGDGIEAVDVTDEAALTSLVDGRDAVISCLPYDLNAYVARAAHATGSHYFDPTEDVRTTKTVTALSGTGTAAMIPQGGVAPGFICIVAAALADRLDEVDSLELRAGGLPRNPANALGYSFTWSPEGVVNEYLEFCEVLRDGEITRVPPLQDLERIIVEGAELEAFTTSGGNGTLCETFAGRVRQLDYKTLRYPGHRDLARFFLEELRMGSRREEAVKILADAYPGVDDDIIYFYVAAQGRKDDSGRTEQFARAYRPREVLGNVEPAIGWTTACGICGVVELFAAGKLAKSGLIRQEEIGLEAFAATRWGSMLVEPTDPTVS
jgi:saccharopine dehydrogenase-like NADP-dependent oxidoreductase